MSHKDENGKSGSRSEASGSVHLTPRTGDGHAPTTSKELEVISRSILWIIIIEHTCS